MMNHAMPIACYCSNHTSGYIPGVCTVPASNPQPLQDSGEAQGLGCDLQAFHV